MQFECRGMRERSWTDFAGVRALASMDLKLEIVFYFKTVLRAEQAHSLTLIWTVNCERWLNLAPHWLHPKGFSSLSSACVLIWSRIWPLKDLPQTSHLYNFLFSWKDKIWRFKVSARGYALSHRWQANSRVPTCSFMCVLRFPLEVNLSEHDGHW